MAKSSSEYIDGTEKYLANLARYRKWVRDTAIRNALKAGGRVLLAAERRRAPVLKEKVGPHSTALDPGTLKNGLRMASREWEGKPQVVVGPNQKTAHVAAWVELGHANIKGKGAGASIGEEDTPAHAWLRPAYESSISGVKEAIVESMREQMKGEGYAG